MKDEGATRNRRLRWGLAAAITIGVLIVAKSLAAIMGFSGFEDPSVSHNPETYRMVVRVTIRELVVLPPIAFGLLYAVRAVLDRTASASIKTPD